MLSYDAVFEDMTLRFSITANDSRFLAAPANTPSLLPRSHSNPFLMESPAMPASSVPDPHSHTRRNGASARRLTLRRAVVSLALVSFLAPSALAQAQHDHAKHVPVLPAVAGVSAQPVKVMVGRTRDALDYLGAPLSAATKTALDAANDEPDDDKALDMIQAALDPYCLAVVHISPESRVKVDEGPAPRELVQNGWRQFLVKVHNEAGVTAPLRALSEQALPIPGAPANRVADRWMDLQIYEGRPQAAGLSGVPLEYRIIQIYSRDAGQRAAVLSFDVGQGSQDLGFRNDLALAFVAAPAPDVTLSVRDENGQPTMAAFEIRDPLGRIYPSQAKRIEPDFAFHPQVYRADGETIALPAGTYEVKVSRGPEYLPITRAVTLGDSPSTLAFQLERWIDPSKFGWWSGDHHIHAAGCAHYTSPTEGVPPEAMFRHIKGEDLKVGSSLNWGPGFDYQKQFFRGAVDPVSQYPTCSGRTSKSAASVPHQSGHLCLLRLREQIYPGGDSKDHWPTLGLNTLKWAQQQGAVCGPAHSGWGLGVPTEELPNYLIPPFDSIGANEYIVDVTHLVEGPDGTRVPAVDFMSTADTPYPWELNMWYHTLNCGFRTRISGETDFPCIYGERVGVGRVYVKLAGALDYDAWCEGISLGRAYVGDGRSHLIDFTVGGIAVGTHDSELALDAPRRVQVSAKVAALLPEERDTSIIPFRDIMQRGGEVSRWAAELRPFWHLERARIGDTRNVKVEVVVNGRPVAEQIIAADGRLRDVAFDVPIERSSWVTMRILGSSHTNPVFVLVGGQPIRASRRSAQWCLDCVDQCWSQKERTYAAPEMDDAKAAYEHARQTYRRILAEAVVE